MAKILKNPSAISAVTIKDIGVTIPASSQRTITDQDYLLLSASVNALTLVLAGTLVVNDGLRDLSAIDGGYFIRYPDDAFNVRFKCDPDRINGFTKRNVQEAVEEARSSAEGLPRFTIRCTYNSTLPNNQWIGPNELMPDTPILTIPLSVQLNEITWSNKNTNRVFIIEFYKNGKLAGDLFHTLTVPSPNPGYGYVTGLNYSFSAGDVIYAKSYTTASPSDTDLILWIKRVT